MMEVDFKKTYYNHLSDNIDVISSVENYRLKLLLKVLCVSLFFFFCACFVLVVICLMVLNREYNPFLFPIFLFLLYIFSLKSITGVILADRKFQQKFNEKILPLLLEPLANFKKWPKNKNTDVIVDSKLFPNFDTQEDDFSVFGYYKSISITISDTRITLPVKASGKPDIFKGIIIQADLEKYIKNHVILISKNEYKNNPYKAIKTNVEDMNENLYTFVQNDSAITFLNEKFWEIVKKIASAYSAKSFSFSYKNEKMLIAMKQRKAMPFGYIFKSLKNPKNYDEFIEKLIVIYEIVDYMNNN